MDHKIITWTLLQVFYDPYCNICTWPEETIIMITQQQWDIQTHEEAQ